MFLSILLDDIDPIKRFVIKKKDPPINTIIITVNIKAITNFFAKIYFFITNPFRILFHKLYLLISVLLAKLWKRIKPRRKPKKKVKIRASSKTVSYTHLTLPTT